MYQLILFVLFSIPITWFSWKPLHDRRAHGFYRYFAFEAILALVLLNALQWFVHPFSILQIVSWLCLLASIFMAVHGFWLLRQVGRPQGSFENTSVLVEIGAYHFIRHPLYSSLFWLVWGACLKSISLPGVLLALVTCAFLFATAVVEEQENLARFGQAYAAYMRRTKMFIPFLF